MFKKIWAIAIASACLSQINAQKKMDVFVGTYTVGSESKGIYLLEYSNANGKLEMVKTFKDYNPEYFAYNAKNKTLYVTNEDTEPTHKGEISAYRWNSHDKSLTLIDKTSTFGGSPCHVSLDRTGSLVTVSNYATGSVAVFKATADGHFLPNPQVLQHTNHGPNPNQNNPHAHGSFYTPDEKTLFIANLGNDTLYAYKVNKDAAEPLEEIVEKHIKVPDGYGPRHLTFSQDGKYLYLLNELEAHVIAYEIKKDDLVEIQDLVLTHIESPDNDKGSAAIRTSPNGRFVYASNRGKTDNIVSFAIGQDGKLTKVDEINVGAHPRDFVVSPDGKFILTASRDKNVVETISIDPKNGQFGKKLSEISIPKPVALLLINK